MLCLNEVLDYEKVPAKIVYYRYEDDKVPVHWHTNLEINCVVKGQCSLNLDGQKYTIPEGGIKIINSGSVHLIRSEGSKRADGLTIVYSNEFLSRCCPGYKEYIFDVNLSPDKINELYDVIYQIYVLFEKRYYEGKSSNIYERESYDYLRVSGLLHIIIFYLMTFFKKKNKNVINTSSEKYKRRFQKIIDYIDIHYKEDISLIKIADYCGLTREHFSRSFKKYMGVTFTEYLNSIRLIHAHRQLVYTDQSVLDIALDCGFPNIGAFNRCFKELYYYTPAKYRKTLEKRNK